MTTHDTTTFHGRDAYTTYALVVRDAGDRVTWQLIGDRGLTMATGVETWNALERRYIHGHDDAGPQNRWWHLDQHIGEWARGRFAERQRHDDVWRDAYHIAWVGASNARAVGRAVMHHAAQLGADHPAVSAMEAHLLFLWGYGIGPELHELNAVSTNAARLGLMS